MKTNFLYGVAILLIICFCAGMFAYVSARQDDCTARGATLVRKPLGFGWVCAKVAP